MSRASSFFFIVIHLLFSAVVAQEKPHFSAKQYDFSVPSHRQNVCDRHAEYYKREVQLRNALKGLELRPLLDESGGLFQLKDGIINPDEPGLIPVLLDELALRCGFEWRKSFAVTPGPGEGHTYTDMLVWGTATYDFVADWFVDSLERLELGIGFPKGFYDGSYILVGKKEMKKLGARESVKLFSWLEPFKPYLWLAIIATMLISAVLYILLENMNSQNKRTWNLSRNVYFSFLLFNQHFNFEPKSHSARLFSVSLAFWSLIVIATYTANLTSFFVVEMTPGFQISSIEDAILANLSICVTQGYTQTTYIRNKYPNGIFIEKPIEEDVFRGVKNGDCVFALTSTTSWEQYQNQRSANRDCDLVWIGRVIKFHDAGFAFKSDAGILCTSLIQDVLNLHLVEMEADGFIEKAWYDFLRKKRDIECRIKEEVDPAEQLTLREMAGAFFVHLMATVLSIVITTCSKLRSMYIKQKRSKKDKNNWSDIPTYVLTSFRNWRRMGKKTKDDTATRLILKQQLIDLSNDLRAIETKFFNDQNEERKQLSRILSMVKDGCDVASTSP